MCLREGAGVHGRTCPKQGRCSPAFSRQTSVFVRNRKWRARRFARKLEQKKPAYRVHYREVGIPWPDASDGIRVSGIYAFVSDAGEVFTVYDDKSMSLWDPDGSLPASEAF